MGAKKGVKRPKPPPTAVRRDAYARLIEMGPERLLQMETLLLQSVYVAEIVRTIQNDWGFFLGENPKSVEKLVSRYNIKVVQTRLKHSMDKVSNGQIGQDISAKSVQDALYEHLDVETHMTEIVTLQRKRILKVYAREEKLGEGLTLESLTKMLKDYNHSLGQLANLQLETGTIKRAPKVIQGSLTGNDPANPGAEARFEFELRVFQDEQAAIAELSGMIPEIIDAEFERLESGSAGDAGATARSPASTGGSAVVPYSKGTPARDSARDSAHGAGRSRRAQAG